MDEPDTCASCARPYRPNKTLVSFMHCRDCHVIGGGHITWLCLYCGWRAAPGHTPPGWQETLSDMRVHD